MMSDGQKSVRCFGMDRAVCADIFGLDVYMERYGHLLGFPDMRKRMAEF